MFSITDIWQGIDWRVVLGALGTIFLIVLVDALLSADNIAILGAKVAHLPERLGGKALTYGLVGAVVGRVAMLFGAKYIIEHPELRVFGGAYLVLLLWNHLNIGPWWIHPDLVKILTYPFRKFIKTSGFWSTVVEVEILDLIFSLDNVIAVVALSSNFVLVIAGVIVSLGFVRFGATLYRKLVKRLPALVHAAFLIVGIIGVRMVLEVQLGFTTPDWVQFVLSMSVLATFGVYGVLHRSKSQALAK